MDRGVWQARVHGVMKSWSQLSDFHMSNILNDLKGTAIKLGEEEQAECKGWSGKRLLKVNVKRKLKIKTWPR